MAAAIGHETNYEFNREVLRLINVAILLGLTNQNVADSNTVALLKSKIAAISVHETDANLLRHIQSAVQAAADAGIFAASDISGLTTTAGLRALFANLDTSLPSTDTRCLAYSPRTGSA